MKVIVFGAGGRMGQELVAAAHQNSSVNLIAAVDRNGMGTHRRLRDIEVSGRGVLIDFSSPAGLGEAIEWSVKNGWALVSGSTGIGKKEAKALAKAAQIIPVLWASNMSLGVAVLKRMLVNIAPLSEHFDFQIEEFHHRFKKDAPSGTAKTLQEVLSKSVKKKLPPVVSVRGGGIFGVHNVWAMSQEEVVRLEHQALNRAVFAKGAFRAAEFLSKKKKGLFEFDEVLG